MAAESFFGLQSMAEGGLFQGIDGYISTSIKWATGLGVGIGSLSIAFNYAKNSINAIQGGGDEGKMYDINYIARIVVMLILLGTYDDTIHAVCNTLVSFNKAFHTTDTTNNLTALLTNWNADAMKEKTPEEKVNALKNDPNITPQEKTLLESAGDAISGAWDSVVSVHDSITGAFRSAFLRLILLITSALTSFIREVILCITTYYAKVLIILGPFALAFGVSPGFTSVIQKWFGSLLTTILAGAVFNLFDALLGDLIQQVVKTPVGAFGIIREVKDATNGEFPFWRIIAFNISIFALYLNVHKITGMVFGSGDAGGVVGKSAQMVQSVVSTSTQMLTGAMQMAGQSSMAGDLGKIAAGMGGKEGDGGSKTRD